MSDHPAIQDRLLANSATLLGGGTWGIYPGECDYARRERWRSLYSPKKGKSVEEQIVFLQADMENLTMRLDDASTKEDAERIGALVAMALREIELLKLKMERRNNEKSY